MKKAIVLPLLLFTIKTFAPDVIDEISEQRVEEYNEAKRLKELNQNLEQLKQEKFNYKDRSKVALLVKPLIEEYSKEYIDSFQLSQNDLADAITVLFLSESADFRGSPSMSPLWRNHNNPFGMTGEGVTYATWEEINGKRVNMYRSFRSYATLKDAIDSLFRDFLLRARFKSLREVTTVKEWFYTMYYCGYMTYSGWPYFAYNNLYLKEIKIYED